MRSYKELENVKVSDMTGEELAMFNRVNDSLKSEKTTGFFGKTSAFVRGAFNRIGDNVKETINVTKQQDKISRIHEIREELSDLDEAYTAGKLPEKKYNFIKAQLELEAEELK